MAQTVYETMFLFNANTYAKNPAATGAAVQEIIESVGGEVLVSRLWNEQKLAYSVQGHRKGVYWLAYFRADGSKLSTFNRGCRLNESILRHLTIKLEPRLVEPMIAIARGENVNLVNREISVEAESGKTAEAVSAGS